MKSVDWTTLLDDSAGPEGCWPWLGAINSDGYAVAYFVGLGRQSVARWSLTQKLGRPIGSGLFALHTCDNRACANPAHLYEGTAADNGRDKAARGRARNNYTRQTLGPVTYSSRHGVVLAQSNYTEGNAA